MLRPVLEAPRPAQTTATSTALIPLSFHVLSGIESGLATQASPQLGGGMSGLETPRATPPPLPLQRGEAPQRSLLGLSWDQLAPPRFLP